MASQPVSASVLRANAAFRSLWIAQSFSELGSQVVRVALPLIALVTLDGSSTEVGFLAAVIQLPYLLFSLHAGAWADRHSPRQLLVTSDAIRAAVFAVTALLALGGWLGMPFLYVAAFIVGSCTVFFDISSQAFVPALVPAQRLAQANGLVESSRSVMGMAGPALAGALVQVAASALALFVSAGLFLASAVSAVFARTPERPILKRQAGGESVVDSIRSGVRTVLRSPTLLWMAGLGGFYNFLFTGYTVVSLIFFVDTLRLSGAQVGLVLAAFGPGFLVGSLVAAKLSTRIGFGTSIVLTAVVSNVVVQLVPQAEGNSSATVVFLCVVHASFAAFNLAHAVLMRTVRQLATPADAQGRVTATNRLIAQGATPLGALTAGWLSASAGPQLALTVISAGFLLVVLLLVVSPIRREVQVLDAAATS